MVASLSSWLQSWPGPGETVEWLLSGLLLLHLLVILFFVFSRGNASAFLQWTVNCLPELNLPSLAELQYGAFQLQVNFLREHLIWKRMFSFGHCPNYLSPPPPLLSGNLYIFFGRHKGIYKVYFLIRARPSPPPSFGQCPKENIFFKGGLP